MRRGGAIAVVLLLACSTDTTPGLVVTIDSVIVATPASGGVSADLMVSYRVGAHAPMAGTFRPDAVQIYLEGALLSTQRPMLPPTFMPTVQPGQSGQIELMTLDTSVMNPIQYCGHDAHVLLRWTGATPTSIGMTMATTTIACP